MTAKKVHTDGTPCNEPGGMARRRKYIVDWLQRLIDTQTDHRSHEWSELFAYAKLHGVKI